MRSIFLFLILGFSMYAQQLSVEQIRQIIDRVTVKHAPDKRTAIFIVDAQQEADGVVLKGETNLPAAKEELLLALNNQKVVDGIEVLPSKDLNGYTKGVVTLSVANIRSKPFHPAELVTQSLLGTPLEVLKSTGDNWYLVQTPDGYIGWLDDGGVHVFTEKEMNNWSKADKMIYTDVYGFVMASEEAKSGTISDITAGAILKLSGTTKKSFKVEFPDGRTGFVHRKSGSPLKKWLKGLKADPNEIIKTAKKFLGVPYLWGGTSPKGLDCSGFTKTVYFLNGILLARDASQQELYGEKVDVSKGYDNLKRGDLLFFGPKPDPGKPQRITHVGIYIGNQEFIHAAGMVRINSFDPRSPVFSEYRTGMLVSAKRILTSLDTPGIKKITPENYIK